MLAAKKESFGYQGSVGDLDSGEDSSWKSCHYVEMKRLLRFPVRRRNVIEAAELIKTWGIS